MASRLLREGESIGAVILVDPGGSGRLPDPGVEGNLRCSGFAFVIDRILFHFQNIKEHDVKVELSHWEQRSRS